MGTSDGTAGAADDKPRLTRTPRPARAVAPWERGNQRSHKDTSGVTVAESIAKAGGVTVAEPPSQQKTRHDAPEDAPCRETATETATSGESGVVPRRMWARLLIISCRSAVALIAVVALAITGSAWHWNSSKDGGLNTVAALDPNSPDIVEPAAQYGDDNFLMVGIDSRAGANGEIGAGTTADAAGARSDTVMLVHVPANRKRVVVVSFPRDLAITPLQCNSWDNDTASYGSDTVYTATKLNSAYAFGGPKCLVKEIQKLSGLRINRFVALDFVGFSKMVDAVGGVDVCSTNPLQDHELGTVLEHAGRQTLDGRSALNYVRARQITTEGNGDYGRIKRQQLFLSSLLRSLISRDVFFSISRLNNVVNTFIASSYVDNVTTKDLVDLGRSIQGVAAGRVTFFTVPTGGTDAEGNEALRVEDTRAIFDAIINGDPLPQENDTNDTANAHEASVTPGAATPTPPASTGAPAGQPNGGELVDAVTTKPGDVTVHVSNATDETGLASTAAGELEQHGFNVLSPDDYPSELSTTTVRFSPGNERAAATVVATFSNPQIERVSGMGDVVQVVLGPDFNAVGAPPPSGSPVRVHVNQDVKAGFDGGSAAGLPRLPGDLTVTNAADTSCK